MAYRSDIETFFFEKGRSGDVFEFRGKKLSPAREMEIKMNKWWIFVWTDTISILNGDISYSIALNKKGLTFDL